ncbi:MAG: molecular chaperone DnaK [Proteobacteria bacterium]|nr:molecular chaperone DnaK [Pseudomonadota bacterium]MBQ4360696.1 molecular chaperone DnaK [Pseudomonadota bacterium]
MSRVIGIDLGTTNSCVSVMEGNEVVVIANREGSRTTPSIVAFTQNGERLVGQMARRQAAKNPKATIYAVKRLIGRTMDDPEVEHIKELVPYEIVPMGSGERKTPGVRIGDKDYSPQEISAMILTQMREVAEDFLGEKVDQAVITVPANFNDSQRQATRDAGRIAGLDVLRVLNEPTAASLGYGFGEDRHETIVVYDLGGGTFDISILRLGDGMYEVLSTLGDPFLGGEDFDNAIVELLLKEFKDENGIDLHDDVAALYRVKEAAEMAKQELSVAMMTEISLPFIALKDGAPIHLSRSLARAEFENLTRDLIEKTIPLCEQAITDAEVDLKDITQIVLVGGMTRMPLVRQRVSEFFNLPINTQVNPDEIVSVGASIQGGVLNGDLEEVMLMDVTPLSLGIETMGGVFMPLIPRNTPIPCEASEIFSTTVDFQEMVNVHVLQGERAMADENHSLARFELWGLPPLLRGMPQIEVSFKIDASGIVSVSAVEKTTGREANVRIEASGGLSEDEITQMIDDAEAQRNADAEKHEKVEKINEAKGMVYMAERSLKQLKDYLKEEEMAEIREELDNHTSYLDNDPSQMLMEDIEATKVALEALAQKIAEMAYNAMM